MNPEFTPILLLIALLAVFYLAVIRPARRQQQATASIQRNLEVGDDVVLSSGIFGTVSQIEEARVRLEVAPDVVIAVARQAVVRRVEGDPSADAAHEHSDEDRTDEDRTDEDRD